METLFAKELIAVFGPAGILFVGGIYFLNKKIKCQEKEDKKHVELLNKHDTAIKLLERDQTHVKESVGRIETQNADMNKKLDIILQK